MAREKKQKKISIYDPIEKAYREVPLSIAKEWVKAMKEVEKQIKKEK